MRRTRHHPKVGLPIPDAVEPLPHTALRGALDAGPTLLVLGVSSAGVGWAVEALSRAQARGIPVLLLTKGLAVHEGRLAVLTDVVGDGLSRRRTPPPAVGGIGGPCIAAELAARRHTAVVVASPDRALRETARGMLSAPYYHVRTTADLAGTEAAAALKNFFTLAVGAAAGELERTGTAPNGAAMHNHAASLFSEAVREMDILARYLGGAGETVSGLAGVGDLYVTCQAGRNSRMGRLLGLGMRYSEARPREMPNDTVEGAELARTVGPTLEALMACGELDGDSLPLTRALLDAVNRDTELSLPWHSFHGNA
jgi:glycerol-3-phosphate dehydrogenase (NAD(P)+)